MEVKVKKLFNKMLRGTKIELSKSFRGKELEDVGFLGRWFSIQSIDLEGNLQVQSSNGARLFVKAEDVK